MSPQCCDDQSAQHGQRHHLESNAEGQNSSSKGTTRFTTKWQQASRRCHAYTVETRQISGMGCVNAWYLCVITSANNSHERRTRSRQVSRLQNSKIPEHLADPSVHTDCNRNSWRMEQPSKKIYQGTWETYHHYHRGSKRDKLYLSANLSGHSERQHAIFHWAIHHRHGLNTTNNSIIIAMIIIILITRDSVLEMLQWQKTLKS